MKLTIPGKPVVKHRPRTVICKGKTTTFTPQATKDWEDGVRWEAKRARVKRLEGDVVLLVDFYLARGQIGDGDNFVKSLADALNSMAYGDDSQIVRWVIQIHRKSNTPRTEVVVRAATDDDRQPVAIEEGAL